MKSDYQKDFFSYLKNIIRYKFFYFETIYFAENNKLPQTTISKNIEKGKKLIIYGFGPYGVEYFLKFIKKNQIIGIYDKNFECMDSDINNPEDIDVNSFDYVIVTVMNKELRKTAIEFLTKKGIPDNKFVYVLYSESEKILSHK